MNFTCIESDYLGISHYVSYRTEKLSSKAYRNNHAGELTVCMHCKPLLRIGIRDVDLCHLNF